MNDNDKRRALGGTHPSIEERLVSEESAGRTPKAARRARPSSMLAKMQARGVRISNIVCFAVIDCDINLRMLAIAIGARFDKGIFPSAVVWLHGTTATLSIFKKRGVFKVVIAGAYTESDARAAVHRVAFAIHCRFGVAASVKHFKVNNVVGSASLGFRVNLSACYAENQVREFTIAAAAAAAVHTATGHMQLQSDKFLGAPVPLLAEATPDARRSIARKRRQQQQQQRHNSRRHRSRRRRRPATHYQLCRV